MSLPKGTVRVDYPYSGEIYRKEDTHWGIPPTDEDPGWLVPNEGAVPIEVEE